MSTTANACKENRRRGPIIPRAVSIIFLCFAGFTQAFSTELQSILEEIKQEKVSSPTQRMSAIQVPSSVSTAPLTVRSTPDPQPVTSVARQVQTKPAAIIPPKVWSPKDKLPKIVDGHGFAGRFAVEGHYEGRLCLVPFEDRANPFARHFVVVNRSLNLPEFHVLPIPERETIEISRDRPLLVERKGIMGYYYVRVQD